MPSLVLRLARHLNHFAAQALVDTGTGIYGWLLEDAARIAVSAVQCAVSSLRTVRLVRFVLFSDAITDAFRRAAGLAD